jgi:energy-converting hydrogenase B subunit I
MSNQGSVVLKLLALPISIIAICLGVNTILGGHITPGGGFQGGAMISGGVLLSLFVYGFDKSPIDFSPSFVSAIESFGALAYVGLGLVGLIFAGSFLYNVGCDFYNIVPPLVQTLFHYPDPTNGGIIPYLNIVVGLKVMVGLTAVALAFSQFKSFEEEGDEE